MLTNFLGFLPILTPPLCAKAFIMCSKSNPLVVFALDLMSTQQLIFKLTFCSTEQPQKPRLFHCWLQCRVLWRAISPLLLLLLSVFFSFLLPQEQKLNTENCRMSSESAWTVLDRDSWMQNLWVLPVPEQECQPPISSRKTTTLPGEHVTPSSLQQTT
jgi:hypothetical protein